MRFISLDRIAFPLFILLLVLSACTVLGRSDSGVTPTALPTSVVSGMKAIPSKACKVAEQSMIQVEEPQGDLISWSGVDDTVAYIAPSIASSRNVGELNTLSAPRFDSPVRLANQVAGELTWSPDATSIAYLGLRRSDNLYTIGLAYLNGRASRDLFPDEAARTDDFSSQKSILEWMDANRLRVYASCGMNCLQGLDIDVPSGLSTPVGDPLERYWDMWAPHTFHPSSIPEKYTQLKGQLNWSWDFRDVALIDERGNLWIINDGSNTIYSVDIGQYGSATETDWSYDNKYLAVQVDQDLMIFSSQCP